MVETLWFYTSKKFKQAASVGKVMVFAFWYSEEIIIIDYLEKEKTIKRQYYASE